MQQRSLASQAGFEKYGRKSRRELFLDQMEQVVPWEAAYGGLNLILLVTRCS